jgi:hypothetical protein
VRELRQSGGSPDDVIALAAQMTGFFEQP